MPKEKGRTYPYCVMDLNQGGDQLEWPSSVHTTAQAADAAAERLNRKDPNYRFAPFRWGGRAADRDRWMFMTRTDEE